MNELMTLKYTKQDAALLTNLLEAEEEELYKKLGKCKRAKTSFELKLKIESIRSILFQIRKNNLDSQEEA